MRLHTVANNAYTTTAAEIAQNHNTFVVMPSILDTLDVPFLVDVGQEIVRVTAVAMDTPEVGRTSWTVVRSISGTAGNYETGVPITLRNYAEHISELQNAIRWMERLLVDVLGGSNGVICRTNTMQLAVKATTGLVVQVLPGAACISGEIAAVLTAQNVVMRLPETGTRTDLIQLSNRGVVSVIEGQSSTPASGNIALAAVTLSHNTVNITDNDITDLRVLL